MYIIPAILAVIANAYILVCITKQRNQSSAFIALVLIFLIHHACEIFSFIEFFKNRQMDLILRVYYAATISALFGIIIYSKKISCLRLNFFDFSCISTAIAIALLVLFTDQIIIGNTSLGYVMTAVKGPKYFIFQFFAIGLLFTSVSFLIYGFITTNNNTTQIQCSYILLALSPLVIISSIIIILMEAGYKINAVGLLPIASALFLLITMRSESEHRLTDIRRFMPFSSERKTSREIMEIYSSYTKDEISYRDCMTKIERLLVMNKYNKSGNNASATAKLMGMPRSSLYSIFNRLKIDVKDQ